MDSSGVLNSLELVVQRSGMMVPRKDECIERPQGTQAFNHYRVKDHLGVPMPFVVVVSCDCGSRIKVHVSPFERQELSKSPTSHLRHCEQPTPPGSNRHC
jgi:hypothetical protein